MSVSVFILPHHDDEIFCIPKLLEVARSAGPVRIYFLTGNSIRKSESAKFLKELGFLQNQICSVYDHIQVNDGLVHLKLSEIEKFILEDLSGHQIVEVISSSYEGGHQDHDACHVLAKSLSLQWGSGVHCFFLYNGWGLPSKFYNVAKAPGDLKAEKRSYRQTEITYILKSIFYFKSQSKAFLGLWPFLVFRSIFGKYQFISESIESEKLSKYVPTSYARWMRANENEVIKNLERFLAERIAELKS